MKILHLCSSDIVGGAARAAYTLHQSLIDEGVSSYMLVQKKRSSDKSVLGAKNNLFWKGVNFLRANIDTIPKRKYSKRYNVPWSVSWLPNPFLITKISNIKPDIIHLHWINSGFISLRDLNKIFLLGVPAVWTLHDSWAFTGGCHIPQDCTRYLNGCENCPLLRSKKDHDLSSFIWNKKNKIYKKYNFTVVTPSYWLKKEALKSPLLKNKHVERIPNAVSENLFVNIQKREARKKLGLRKDKIYILFGAMAATNDKNKGFDLLLDSLQFLQNNKNDIELIVFGNKEVIDTKCEIPIHAYGKVSDRKKISYIYSAVDITAVPSRSESFSLVTLESFMCSTPVVAFNIGGIKDIIDHKINGYKAKPFETHDLAHGIEWCTENNKRNECLSIAAREKAMKEFSLQSHSQKYIELYKSLI